MTQLHKCKKYQTDGLTDGLTNGRNKLIWVGWVTYGSYRLIWVGLGNLWFLQANIPLSKSEILTLNFNHVSKPHLLVPFAFVKLSHTFSDLVSSCVGQKVPKIVEPGTDCSGETMPL